MLTITYYRRPDGRTQQVVLATSHIDPDDEVYFTSRAIGISMEDDAADGLILYADIGRTTDEGEPDEIIVFSGEMTCRDAMHLLRKQCEAELGEVARHED